MDIVVAGAAGTWVARRPDSFYGVSKITGKTLGTYHADEDGIEVANLRIGWLLTRDELHSS